MILITAFEPFNQRKSNTSLMILNALSTRFDKLVLPVSVEKIEGVINQIAFDQYDKIILLGEANRGYISIEKHAYNELDIGIKDNDGIQINKQPIKKGLSDFETPLPISDLLKPGIEISTDPGRFLCNMAYYLVSLRKKQVVFIHVSEKHTLAQTRKVEALIDGIEKITDAR